MVDVFEYTLTTQPTNYTMIIKKNVIEMHIFRYKNNDRDEPSNHSSKPFFKTDFSLLDIC